MDKLLIIDKDNKLLVSMDKEEIGDEIIVDNSIWLTSNWDAIVIQLKEDYWTHWDAEVLIKDWELYFDTWEEWENLT